ncbi:TerB family tellurite resistance protein [uncultured Campylobacter sp.]|uniref:TerB family tellurite resistance protein n=1 Tax=uncultured Campylobacter sp. TaxID=218934 RepID=UPI003211C2A7
MFGMFNQELYKFYQLAAALQFLKMGNKGLVQTEKDQFIEFARKLKLDIKFDSFDELAAIVKFKINEEHKNEDIFEDTPSHSISKLLSKGSFSKIEIANIIWTLINLAYADGEFSNDEEEVMDRISKRFEIKSSVIEELKDCAKTLACLEAKSEWIETTNKSYKEVKAVKDEIEKDEALVAVMVSNIIYRVNAA